MDKTWIFMYPKRYKFSMFFSNFILTIGLFRGLAKNTSIVTHQEL